MNTHKYNGWTNYETFTVNSWYQDLSYLFEDHIEDLSDEHDDKQDVLRTIASWIEEHINEEVDLQVDNRGGFVGDLMNAALIEVDWLDLADHYIDDVWDDIETHRLNQREPIGV